jgi:hypothetical protein
MATRLDLADAQFIGFGLHHNNGNRIIMLVEGMGLTKKEWMLWKEKYPTYPLDDALIKEVDEYFERNPKQ